MENKKIKNAKSCVYDNIQFKSQLESRLYKLLKEKGFDVKYEEYTYTLCPSFKPEIPFYNKTKVKGFHLDNKIVRAITYTPDFTFLYKDLFVIVEAKGFENDSFPIKKRLFRYYLENNIKNAVYLEVRSQRELLTALKELENYGEKL